ncbi:NAD-binding, UDP-glucose/GDP-mannose dehydrogenase family protein [Maribacter phage Molly_5]|nr:NAD-binding, UDP-glucose/GDP-mannose dehydrogenase family protein [Maribacter phage Molly_4]QQO98190.1 NAD-binding, UDP-glucose/GDP-mannose dehydrogenase family protein [Maribacter phage Molly_5]
MKKIGIVGLGYVGLTLAAQISKNKDLQVFGADLNSDVTDSLNIDKAAHFYEKGLDHIIEDAMNTNLSVGFELPMGMDIIIVTVGTPANSSGLNSDYLKAAIKSNVTKLNKGGLFILRSTVDVGRTRDLKHMAGSYVGYEVNFSFCPERTIEGKAVAELESNPQIVSGDSQLSLDMATDFFNSISPAEIVQANSLESAELSKLFCNIYRDMSFAIGNAFSDIAQDYGVDASEAINNCNKNYSRSNIHQPGFVGGPCLTKDTHILLANSTPSPSTKLLEYGRIVNSNIPQDVSNWIYSKIQGETDLILISGLAFKGIPETSDVRDSQSLEILNSLFTRNKQIRLHDFTSALHDPAFESYSKAPDNFLDATKHTSIIVILNNHEAYSDFTIGEVQANSPKDSLILDCWSTLRTDGIWDNKRYFTLTNFK